MLDEKGKIFGIVNIIDLSFAILLIAMLSGLIWARLGTSPIDKKIIATGKAEFQVAIRGARVKDKDIFKKGEKAFLTIRNQNYQKVEITDIQVKRRQIAFMNPEGKVIVKDDPTTPYLTDIDLTFQQVADLTEEGLVMGGHYLKVGNPIELNSINYRFHGSIMFAKLLE